MLTILLMGVGIVGHGRSKAASVTAAIDSACISLEGGLVDLMRSELARVRLNVPNVKDEQEE